MVAKREKTKPDSTIYFSAAENTGVLIQHQFRRAIYFVRGIKEDDLYWNPGDPAKKVDDWVMAKRRAFDGANG